MANIRTKLIHLLGGVTKEEHSEYLSEIRKDALWEGMWIALSHTMKCMKDNYGNPEWGQIVYNFVKDWMVAKLEE